MAEDQFTDKQVAFKAWVETGKLHVHGEVHVEDTALQYQLDKREQQGYFADELFLEIKPDPSPGGHTVEIKYHEALEDAGKYKKIVIFAKSEQVQEIQDIPQK